MLRRIYLAVWLFVGFAAMAAYLAGFLNSLAMIVLGLVVLGTIFMGIIAVLPASVQNFLPTE